MSLRPLELDAVARELDGALRGAAVQRVHAPSSSRVYLELRTPGRSVVVHLCAEPGVARVAVVEARPPGPLRPPGWQSTLRKHLVGARVRDFEALAPRQTLLVHLERPGATRLVLALEAGAPPGLFLLDGEARVLCQSMPARDGLRIGATWAPRAEAPLGVEPSRLSGDRAFLRLAHAAEGLFERAEQTRRTSAAGRPLRRRLEQLRRTRAKVEAEGARAQGCPGLRREAELLAQNLQRLERGMREIELPEYRADGTVEHVRVLLDPRRAPRDEVAGRFKQARRLERGAQLAKQRLEVLDAELQRLEAELAELQGAGSPEAAPGAAAPGPQRLDPPPRPRSAGGTGAPPFRAYVGAGGAGIWVGRGASANERLTFREARPHHLWLHARGVGGAHVIVPCARAEAVAAELLLDAAHLALHHSELRGEPRGDVSVTEVRYVRRVKGGAPGAVTYSRERTVHVRLEPERLERLLRQREEAGA